MPHPEDAVRVDERLDALREYAKDINDLEVRTAALKDLRDVVIVGLGASGVSTRIIGEAAGISHVRVAAIANQKPSAA